MLHRFGVLFAPPAGLPAAIAMMVCACALMAATMLIAKLLGPAHAGEDALHPLQVTAGRFVFAALALTPLLASLRPSFRGAAWAKHALRVTCGCLGVSCLFAAAAAMRLADATAISYLNPIVAMILAGVFLREKVGAWRWGAAAAAFAGAALLTGLGTGAFQPVALIALLAAVFIGMELIVVKMLADTEPPLRILAVSNLAGAALSLAAAALVWRWPAPWQWGLLALLGVTMLVVQFLFMSALKRAQASFILPFSYSTLIFAALYDLAVFAVLPTPAGIAGAALIVAGAGAVAWSGRRGSRDP